MSTINDHLVDWLRDAHAMEQQAETMLNTMASRVDDYPDLKARILSHVEETRAQADRLRSCIEKRGEGPSIIKDTGGKLMGMAQGLTGLIMEDEVVKGVLASYTFEHMEIMSYRLLIKTAELADDSVTAGLCEQSLNEEIAMQRWLEENAPKILLRYVDLDRAA
ncbi:hypothetical protein BN1110_04842 [bacterium YEK0313]|nr:hypothetical protein BN1110_04842 [bacterium YEK0313]